MEGAVLIASLRQALPRRARRILVRDGRAAVLVPIVDDAGGLGLLLTRRAIDLPTHRGQVAFPGGHADPGDAGPIATALREAGEEIGLAPDRVDLLGLLDDQVTREGTVAVTPVVGVIAGCPPLGPRSAEVARVFTIPLDQLARQELWRIEGSLDFFDYDGETLWGLSARIVRHLLELAAHV